MPIVVILAFALLIGAAVTWIWASGEGWRWGWTIDREIELGEGAYRSAPVALMKPRRRPMTCGLGAASSVAWGMLTLLCFAPAGLAFVAFAMPRATTQDPLRFLGALLVLLTSAHGFLLGLRLIGLVTALAIRTELSVERIERAAVVSIFHHLMVFVSFAVVADIYGETLLLTIAAVSCAVGLAHAWLLWRARGAILRIDREDRILLAR